ncbi:uncharacterized protein TNCV_1996151 [Trichonephila clavipes]|uniref:Uncharacterized protein n=1 Tax=Trichonephila clavipes TaxID=2585209 RepID=A0A8X6V2K0_TRICX|nr:uncharacterized protein TNCV_1996151 [Trichonephila clavipes]
MSACGREFHSACMCSKSSSFETAGRGSRARRRPTKPYTSSIGDIFGEYAGQGRSCMFWAEQNSPTVLATCGRALFY